MSANGTRDTAANGAGMILGSCVGLALGASTGNWGLWALGFFFGACADAASNLRKRDRAGAAAASRKVGSGS